ncbi:MAG: hypothetical protein Faunusvirus6_4 [Faunusvirus sp.]|jgi:hypothetical protein|uniref:Uncharacterized protein n=1 Tax=Faunusvirus sp. TaxID=2487766 RepID=A0A3G4ZWF6_9VIRU|nr:MAG: hypothetical protein Faunusvirus6_4 [Faunusvirus sp.]
MNSETVLTSLFIILISSLIGFTIVHIIDKHLSDVSINMPVINIPPSEITLSFDKHQDNNGLYNIKVQQMCKNAEPKNNVTEQFASNTSFANVDNKIADDKTVDNKSPNCQDDVKCAASDMTTNTVMTRLYQKHKNNKKPHIKKNKKKTQTAEQYYENRYCYPFVPQQQDDLWSGANYKRYDNKQYNELVLSAPDNDIYSNTYFEAADQR